MTTQTTLPSAAPESNSAHSLTEFPAPPADLVDLMRGPFAPQKKFKVPKGAWLRRFRSIPRAAEAINDLPAWINRDDAVEAFRIHWPDNVVGAFAASMVWAYGEKAGYAPYRVLRVITACKETDGAEENLRVRDALRRAVKIASADGAVEGYSFLNDCTHKVKSHQRDDADLLVGVDCGRIYGLGPSFFTKWLHIGSLALDDGTWRANAFDARANSRNTGLAMNAHDAVPPHPPAPMLDNQALTWLDVHARGVDTDCLAQDHSRKVVVLHRKWHAESVFSACTDDCPFQSGNETHRYDGLLPVHPNDLGWSPTTPEGDLRRLRSGRTDHYARFVALLAAWGDPYGIDASQVCDRIYRLIRQDGDPRQLAA